jgi:hypothetical protein
MDSTETLNANSQESPHPEKPLGRGLQDISHLFLSKRTTPSAPTQPEGRPRSLLLKASVPASRNALATILTDLDGGFAEGLRVIDTALPCNPYGHIDLLALDGSNQLVIIDFETADNDGLLMRGMSHFDWLIHNLFNIRRMYALETINVLAEPKLVLLAPQFSGVFRSVARHVASPRIECIQYRVAETLGSVGIMFERVTP